MACQDGRINGTCGQSCVTVCCVIVDLEGLLYFIFPCVRNGVDETVAGSKREIQVIFGFVLCKFAEITVFVQ